MQSLQNLVAHTRHNQYIGALLADDTAPRLTQHFPLFNFLDDRVAYPSSFSAYANRLRDVLAKADWSPVGELGDALLDCWIQRKQVFICGNGGSAGNAIHLANDFLYGIGMGKAPGIRVSALPANTAVLTCLANDITYQEIFSEQLRTLGNEGDVLLVLSGSGNSPNILSAITASQELGMRSFGILGYSGGKAKTLVDVAIHFAIDDMQIAEDLQLIVGHMLMQRLANLTMSING